MVTELTPPSRSISSRSLFYWMLSLPALLALRRGKSGHDPPPKNWAAGSLREESEKSAWKPASRTPFEREPDNIESLRLPFVSTELVATDSPENIELASASLVQLLFNAELRKQPETGLPHLLSRRHESLPQQCAAEYRIALMVAGFRQQRPYRREYLRGILRDELSHRDKILRRELR